MLRILSIGAATFAALVLFAPTPVRATSSSVAVQINYALEDLDPSDGVTPKLTESRYGAGAACAYSDPNWGSWGHSFFCGLYVDWRYYPQLGAFGNTASGGSISPTSLSVHGSTADPAGGYEAFAIYPFWSDFGPAGQFMALSSMTRLTMTVDVVIQAQGQNVCVDLVCINGSASGSFRFFVSGSALFSVIEPFGLAGAGALHRELVFENTGPHEAELRPRMELGVSGLNEETAAPPIPEIETYWMMALGLVAVWASRRYKSRGA